MAFLQNLSIRCDEQGCTSVAKVRLFDWRNEDIGKFCRKCGRHKLDSRQKFEDKHPLLKR